MTAPKLLVWLMILIGFARGLFVWDMGGSAASTYPHASAVCLSGSVIAAALMYLADSRKAKS